MPSIEAGPARPVGAVDVRLARTVSPSTEKPAKSASSSASTPALVSSEVLDAGTPPIDNERVAVIRKAIENGSYPVIPTRIADAVIAAGMLWRMDS